MPRRPKKGDFVLVTWEDHAEGNGDEPDAPVFETPGFFVRWETRNGVKGVYVAPSRKSAGKYDYTGDWYWYVKGAIRSIELCGVFK